MTVPDERPKFFNVHFYKYLGAIYYLLHFLCAVIQAPTLFFIYLLFTRFYFVPIIYAIWFYLDRNTDSKSYRRIDWVRQWRVWTYMAQYFPVKLIKTADLPKDKNYIFGLHPHGIFCFSHFVNFSTEGTNFGDLFPGIRTYLVTLKYQLIPPLHRDLFLSTGLRYSSKESINYILSKEKNNGRAAAIVVGGAQEMLDTIPKTFVLYLKKRKGFIRLALKNGASLVPVLSLGENELYWVLNSPDPENIIRKFQKLIIKILGFPLPIFFGQLWFPFLPLRNPVFTIVGRPIPVEKAIESPTEEQIDQLHQRYINELTDLYEQNKHKYNFGDIHLKIK